MRRLIPLIILLFFGGMVTMAQDDCGDGLPCGKLPWDLPDLLVLPSPSPMPTAAITIVPTTDGTITATPTAYLSATPLPTYFDMSNLNNQLSTLNAYSDTDPGAIQDLNGTPVNAEESLEEVGSNTSYFFGYMRGLSEFNLGKSSSFLGFALLSLIVVVSLKSLTLMLPMVIAIFGMIYKAVRFLLSFLGVKA